MLAGGGSIAATRSGSDFKQSHCGFKGAVAVSVPSSSDVQPQRTAKRTLHPLPPHVLLEHTDQLMRAVSKPRSDGDATYFEQMPMRNHLALSGGAEIAPKWLDFTSAEKTAARASWGRI